MNPCRRLSLRTIALSLKVLPTSCGWVGFAGPVVGGSDEGLHDAGVIRHPGWRRAGQPDAPCVRDAAHLVAGERLRDRPRVAGSGCRDHNHVRVPALVLIVCAGVNPGYHCGEVCPQGDAVCCDGVEPRYGARGSPGAAASPASEGSSTLGVSGFAAGLYGPAGLSVRPARLAIANVSELPSA